MTKKYLQDLSPLIFLAKRLPRWNEYGSYLGYAKKRGYKVISLDEWFLRIGDYVDSKILILRHDVDRDLGAAVKMNEIEMSYQVHSTFYFRWYTANEKVISKIKKHGSSVGFHYETLSRYALIHGIYQRQKVADKLIEKCRELLKEEIAIFKDLYGEISSIAHHGDWINRQIGISNLVLMKDQEYRDYGIYFDASDEKVINSIDIWVSDGAGYNNFWNSGISFLDAIKTGNKVILFNSHPGHWNWGFLVILRGFFKKILKYDPCSVTWQKKV